MKRAMLLLAVACWTRDARAQMTVSGSPAQMNISAAVAGSPPTDATNSLTTYNTGNPTGQTSYTITAQIDSPMPAGVTLTITLQSAGSGSSAGAVSLTTTPSNVITGIKNKVNNATITYDLSATAAAGVVPLQTRQVSFTVITIP